MSFLFLHEDICCGYSLEAPRMEKQLESYQYLLFEKSVFFAVMEKRFYCR